MKRKKFVLSTIERVGVTPPGRKPLPARALLATTRRPRVFRFRIVISEARETMCSRLLPYRSSAGVGRVPAGGAATKTRGYTAAAAPRVRRGVTARRRTGPGVRFRNRRAAEPVSMYAQSLCSGRACCRCCCCCCARPSVRATPPRPP